MNLLRPFHILYFFAVNLILASIVILTEQWSAALGVTVDGSSIIGLSTNLAIVAVLLIGKEYLLGFFLGKFFFLYHANQLIFLNLLVAGSYTFEAWLASYFIGAFTVNRAYLNDIKEIVIFIFPASLLSAFTGAVASNVCLAIFQRPSDIPVLYQIMLITTGHSMAIWGVTPLLLLISQKKFWNLLVNKRFELSLLLLCLVSVCWVVFLVDSSIFNTDYAYQIVLFPLLIWSVIRFSQVGAAISSFIVFLFIVYSLSTAAVDGGSPESYSRFFYLWLFFFSLIFSAYLFGGLFVESQTTRDSLLELEELLAGVLNSSMNGIMAFRSIRDDLGRIEDFVCLMMNPAAERLLNRPQEKLYQKKLLDSLPGVKELGLFDRFVKVVEHNIPSQQEIFYNKDGLNKWFHLNVVKLGDGFSATFTDISHQKTYESERERLVGILENSTDSICMMEPEGQMFYMNKAARELLGVGFKRNLSEFNLYQFHPDWAGELIKETGIPSALENRVWIGETALINHQGIEIPVSQMIIAHRERYGKAHYFSTIMRDVSHFKHVERDLKKAIDSAEAASVAKSQFLSTMSHELRTPLNSIIGFTNILLKNKNDSIEEKEMMYLSRVKDNSIHLLQLINDILDISKIEAGKMDLIPSTFALDEMLQEIIQQMEGRIYGKNVRLCFESFPEMEPIHTDAARLKQVFINLIDNAIKFTDQGEVTVRIVESAQKGIPDRVEVQDTGIGIPNDQLPLIFEKFIQADGSQARKHAGTGLGLAISKSLCEIMGHSLVVKSEVGSGSTFSVLLFQHARVLS